MQRRFCACLALALAYLACVPSAGADDAAAEGERIYENYCATCHGERGEGTSQAPPIVGLGPVTKAKFFTPKALCGFLRLYRVGVVG